jgi:uncharacterized protein (TIRG00374 family)
LAWLLALGLLGYALLQIPLEEIWRVLQNLSMLQILILLLVNSAIILLFGGRWWLILRAQGYSIPYFYLARYRLTAFAVSYFTPGPHFGGEPLQVYSVQKNHGVPGPAALAALSLDKLLELIANFSFLAFGVASVLLLGTFGGVVRTTGLPFVLVLLAIPVLYMAALFANRLPLSNLARRMPAKGKWQKFSEAIIESEQMMAHFCREQPGVMVLAFGLSGFVWMLLVFEYWLALSFLGLSLGFWEIIAVMTAARAALLTPLPGAIGVLEYGQVLAMQALNYDPALGISIGLIIRARDVSFGLLGLWLGGWIKR